MGNRTAAISHKKKTDHSARVYKEVFKSTDHTRRNDVFHCVEHNVHFVYDVWLRQMMCLRAWVEEHIASFYCVAVKHHCVSAQHHLPDRASITKNRLNKKSSRSSCCSFIFKCALTHYFTVVKKLPYQPVALPSGLQYW